MNSLRPNRRTGLLAARIAVLCLTAWVKLGAQVLTAQDYNYIESYSTTGQDVGTFASSGLSNPSGMVFNSSGSCFVSNYGSGNIEEFSPNGVGTNFLSGFLDPNGLAIDQSNNLYVESITGSPNGNEITRITPSGAASNLATVLGRQFFGIAVDNNDEIYASLLPSSGSSVIDEFSPTGVLNKVITTGGEFYGLAIGSNGNLYGADFENNTIYDFSSNGVESIFATKGLNEPSGLAFDASGNLFVANEGNNTITEYDSNGNESLFATTNSLAGPIAVATPEPSSWALFLLGVIFVGVVTILKRVR